MDIAHELLKNGHIVNITTNGTLKKQFMRLEKFKQEEKERLHFSFSFHYLELRRSGTMDIFFENVNFVQRQGCSFVVQLNLCDEYISCMDEIKKVCIRELGALPQIAATRKEDAALQKIELLTDMTQEEYISYGKQFQSPLFEYTMENFNVKREEFCYAGQRSGTLNLADGSLCKCYADPRPQNIFENVNKPIKFEPMGENCGCSYCFNSSHFKSLGVIDDNDTRTYCSLRDREEAKWFNDTVKYALSQKLWETNVSYEKKKQKRYSRKQCLISAYYRNRRRVVKSVRKILEGKNHE